VTNGQVPDSDPVMFSSVGTFYWQASYSGDPLNNPSSTACGEETVTVPPTPTPTSDSKSKRQHQLSTSPSTATATQGRLFVYQVTATGSPSSYNRHTSAARPDLRQRSRHPRRHPNRPWHDANSVNCLKFRAATGMATLTLNGPACA